ncbi:MAG: glycoside hydrolase family 6 protein [Micropruina sp.]|uniref:glycoside hydrolase family 6 protein n=1 Tax=Micropruina sp. TaxID=2737536 RepID=UPI0039E3D788
MLAGLGLSLSWACTPTPQTSSPPPVNPLYGERLWVDPSSTAARAAAKLRSSGHATDAKALAPITSQPVATWLADDDVKSLAKRVVDAAEDDDAVPVLVLYNRPQRDCGSYSSGGADDADEYREWVARLAGVIGDRRVVVVLEPDAVPQALSGNCPTSAEETYELLASAVTRLATNPNTLIYIDAGHPAWIADTARLAEALRRSGIAGADGFSLNVSNFHTDADNQAYGDQLATELGGVQYVVDTSRNGAGAGDAAPGTIDSWCNPPGAALGKDPEIGPLRTFAVAGLWIKEPGASDGNCRTGEPAAGTFWFDYALRLIRQRG